MRLLRRQVLYLFMILFSLWFYTIIYTYVASPSAVSSYPLNTVFQSAMDTSQWTPVSKEIPIENEHIYYSNNATGEK